MAFRDDPTVEPFNDAAFVMCGLMSCQDCCREPSYQSDYPEGTEENWYDQAVVMKYEGWVLLPEPYQVVCPECAAARGLTR